MPSDKRGARSLKGKVLELLQADTFLASLEEIKALPGRQVINPLFSFLLHQDQRVRWRAVAAMGAVIANLADSDMESARVIMRRLMWSLNDESGGIGWGAPEVMGEAMFRHERIAEEYASILVSYTDEEGNFLEYEILQRGLLWGLARLAGIRPHLVEPVAPHLGKYLESDDTFVRGLAAHVAGLLRIEGSRDKLLKLSNDPSELTRYVGDKMVGVRVCDLAREALSLLDGRNES
jgi:hypothetical protein